MLSVATIKRYVTNKLKANKEMQLRIPQELYSRVFENGYFAYYYTVLHEKELANWDANEKILKKHGFKFYYVVDGQQRLTTFLILLNSIIQLVSSLPENKDKDDNFIDLECETIAEIKDQREGICSCDINFNEMYKYRNTCTILKDIRDNYEVTSV